MKSRIRSLDGLRGVSAFVVLLFHVGYHAAPGTIFTHGYLAVDIFFLMSGFVIAASYEDRLLNGLSPKSFIEIRIKRLAPVYWAGTIIGFACFVVPMIWSTGPLDGVAVLLLPILLVLALLLLPHGSFGTLAYPVNGPAWSLFLEMAVNYLYSAWIKYFTSPVLCGVAAVGYLISTGIAAWSGVGWNFGWATPAIYIAIVRAAPSFAVGVLLYRARRNGQLGFLPSLPPSLLILGWFGLLAYPSTEFFYWDTGIVLFVAPLLVALLVRTERPLQRWFAVGGALSYPLYASHYSIVRLAYQLPFVTPQMKTGVVYGAGVIAVALAVAWAIHHWVEGISLTAGTRSTAAQAANN